MPQEKWLLDGPKTIDFERVHTLKVGLIGGQIDIVAHDEPGVRLEVHSVTGKALKVTLEGDTLEIDHPQLGWDNFLDVFSYFKSDATAQLSILVPRGISLKFGVVTAGALISGLSSNARISTVSGEVVVTGGTGDLDINAVNGEVSVHDHTGALNIKTVSGDVTATGEITKFTGDSVSGAVFLDLAGEPDKVRVNTVSGSVTTRLVADLPLSYAVTTASGRLQFDDRIITVRGSSNGQIGELHGRWLEFKANTVSGDVAVMHAGASA